MNTVEGSTFANKYFYKSIAVNKIILKARETLMFSTNSEFKQLQV